MERLDETHKAAWRMLLVARTRLTEKIDQEMTEAGVINLDWYDVLLWLEESGGRLKMGELAERVLFSRSGLTRLVDRLEAAGLLKREHCSEDRRAVYAVLTEAGLVARKAAWTVYEPSIARHFARFVTGEEAAVIRDALTKAVEART